MSNPATNNWTPEQWLAINTVGKSLLVSAAAGSGKTSVLAERCVHLLCEGEPDCEVGHLLVVTFTEAAALEMKSRIAKSLSQRHASAPGELTARHMAMLDRASIGTLHSFCARLLRQNFQLLGLDPAFRILDADEAELQQLDVARELFAERYDDPEAEDFRRFIDCYADGNDDKLVRQVIKMYGTLCSVVDPIGWLKQARTRIDDAVDFPLEKTDLGKAHIQSIASELESLLDECQASAATLKSLGPFESYIAHLRKLYSILKNWLKILKTQGLDALTAHCANEELDKLPTVASTVANKAIAKKLIDSIQNALKKGSWRNSLRFSSDEWKTGLSQIRPHADVLLSLVSDFADAYSRAKGDENVLDFADLERLTLRALKVEGTNPSQPTPLARSFHHQFKHVLVDEYQDINQVQDEILSLLSRECVAGAGSMAPNLFCVGDVKQSIYRFRLAEARQFLDRRERYSQPQSHGRVIDLQTNFRSRAPLLEAINGVFQRLMTFRAADLDYDDTQKLSPGQKYPTLENGFVGSPIELHLLPKDASDAEEDDPDLDRSEREATVVAHRILQLVRPADGLPRQVANRPGASTPHRAVQFSDIVILLRSLRFKADQFAAVLRNMGVPVHTESSTGYFEATEINDVLSLLHVLDNQRQDIPLAALLRSPLSGLSNIEDHFARIRLAYAGEPFHLAVKKYAELQSDSLAQSLKAFLQKIEHWRQQTRRHPVADVLWQIYDQTGYLAYVAGLVNGEQRQANLIELHDRARQFASFNRQGLARFLVFLEKLKKERDLGQASIASEADNVVRIMSIHRSKGLEFPVVILPDLGKAFNLQDTQGLILIDRHAGLGMRVVDDTLTIQYDSLAYSVVQNRLQQQSLAEELRVLYVAMTRAKEHLILVGTCPETKPAEVSDQWSKHIGPFSAATVLGAHNTLDWLLLCNAVLPNQFQTQMHNWAEISTWAAEHNSVPEQTPRRMAVTLGKPLSPAPPLNSVADELLARLSRPYPHAEFADIAAAVSVTALIKKNDSVVDATRSNAFSDRMLSQPPFVAGNAAVSAVDKGTATHIVLEHFDFTKPDAIQQQINHLVSTRRLDMALAAEVDLATLKWFLGTEVGQLIQQSANRLHRELPIYFANPSGAADPLDRQMVRGRIDLLVPTNTGWMIVDYKTDKVTGPALEERTNLYAGQLQLYRDAVRQITGTQAIEGVLIFLTAQQIRKV